MACTFDKFLHCRISTWSLFLIFILHSLYWSSKIVANKSLTMYRSAAKRLLPAFYRRRQDAVSCIRTLAADYPTRFMTSAATGNIPDQNPIPVNPILPSSNPTDSTASSSWKEEERTRFQDTDAKSSSRTKRPKAHYKDEEALVLSASLSHVVCYIYFLFRFLCRYEILDLYV